MFDVASSELLMVAVVALVVIGPKDLPRVMRVVGHWMGKARGVARHFRAGMDEMIRQSEMEELNRKWAEQNERIMREHPMTDEYRAATEGAATEVGAEEDTGPVEDASLTEDTGPVMTPRPDLVDLASAPPAHPAPRQEG